VKMSAAQFIMEALRGRGDLAPSQHPNQANPGTLASQVRNGQVSTGALHQ